jgi:hypothetical protein
MVATAQRFCETHPEVEIAWEKRSLQEFADYPIPKLAEQFDLLVIDHAFVGYAAFQDEAAQLVHTFLREGGNARLTTRTLQAHYERSNPKGN